MSKRPWTPGPWRTIDRGCAVVWVDAPKRPTHVFNETARKMERVEHTGDARTHGYGCGNDFICDLNDGEYHEYNDRTEQVANAELIALAPEMAEAILAWADTASMSGEFDYDSLHFMAEKLRAISERGTG